MNPVCLIAVAVITCANSPHGPEPTVGVVIRSGGVISTSGRGQRGTLHPADRLYSHEILNCGPESVAIVALVNGSRYELIAPSKVEISSYGVRRISGRTPRLLQKLDPRFLRNLVSKSRATGTPGGDISRGSKGNFGPIGAVRPGRITLAWECAPADEPVLHIWSEQGTEKLKKSLAAGTTSFALPEEYGRAGVQFTWTVIAGEHSPQGGTIRIPSNDAMNNLLALEQAEHAAGLSKEEHGQLRLLLEYNYQTLGLVRQGH